MHEMGIAMQIIEIATASIPEDMHGCRVSHVNLEIGKLSTIVPDSLTFCFEIAAQDTPLSDATLVIDIIPVTATCNDCNTHFTIETPAFSCIKCNSGSIEMSTGRELDIKSIEIDD